jgi:phage gp29-like protein
MLSDSMLSNLLKPRKNSSKTEEKRIEKVIQAIESEQKVNDVITFGVGKTFSTLMVLLAPLFAFLGKVTHK